MDSKILRAEIQQFINDNIDADVSKLALTRNPFAEIPFAGILNQISAKAKAKEKLPTWFNTPGIIYPSRISVEQTSSETTAAYKSELVYGNLIDLTGGFGVDDYFFSKNADSVTHCEIDEKLSATAKHNFKQLKAENIECIAGDSNVSLRALNRHFDFIYIDPSRRNEAKGKVFLLKDCLPDVPGNLDFYFSFSDNILVKTSPLLDLTAGLSELSQVKAIHIVAVKNEVKELVWEMDKSYLGKPEIRAVNIENGRTSVFEFTLGTESILEFSLPKKYLYEPNAAIMKSGGFDQVGSKFKLGKLHRHSHLYTSDEIKDFPGRAFEITDVIPYSKNGMRKVTELKKANITTRNFPESVDSIRKKWKIADGGSAFCFFTTDQNDNKIVLICTKILQ